MEGKLRLGVIGLGNRGYSILENILLQMEDVEITALCDTNAERVRLAEKTTLDKTEHHPFLTGNFEEVIASAQVDAVVINTGWGMHVPVAAAAMRAGKYTAFEVGGAYSIEECWQLVRAYEETKTPCMMMENCCYGRNELMLLNMARQGLFGEIVHCSGGYHHDLRDEDLIAGGMGHYRIKDYIMRNADTYPTHELGPIAKVLGINRGNRMMTLTSTASKAAGLQYHISKNESELSGLKFLQGDIVTTVIKCALGQTIALTLDTTLPRPYYSRALQIRGVKGLYIGETDTAYIEGDYPAETEVRGNGDEYRERYDHPLWKEYLEQGVKVGHGGIDWLVYRAFVESAQKRVNTPIDVYDAAAWMSISVLSEQSIACGGMPVPIPDFTNGKWLSREPAVPGKYCLD